MIRVSHLSKSFGSLQAVKRLSFDVAEGESLVLLGTSGCGKTTTLKMINRLIEPSDGTVFINDQDIRDQLPETLRRSIGYVIQNIGLFPHYTVEQNVSLVPRLLQWKEPEIRSRTHELLNRVGLPPDSYARRYPDALSGGQQQRVGLARALAADPPLVLLDEPFGALDPITRRDLQNEFKQLETLLHKTMILVSHDVFESFELGDRICLMDQGEIQQIATARDMLFQPANDFVRDFFQANRFQVESKSLPWAIPCPNCPKPLMTEAT
ncbi:MAG: ATP-binding cassette domain-containing protein [candidate division KSB1 bacterium]|nr:ATP-binding cassette domain-containing protein [candidate division KSB1 bacterium]